MVIFNKLYVNKSQLSYSIYYKYISDTLSYSNVTLKFKSINRKNLLYIVFDVQVYIAVFQPLRVSRHQFKKVLNCMKIIRQLKYQEVYAQEKVTKVDSLSLVLSGK